MRRIALSGSLAAALAACACGPQQPADGPVRAQGADLDRLCAERRAAAASASPAPPAPTAPPPPATTAAASSGPPGARPKPPALPRATGTIAPSGAPRSIRVHVLAAADPYLDCIAHPWVTRTVPAGANPVEAALRAVIGGPTPFEEEQGLLSPYRRSVADPSAPPLSPSQVKVTVKDGVAVVDFAPAATPYLMQAICARMGVTSAIEYTLLQFREIKQVKFALGGKIIEEWDA